MKEKEISKLRDETRDIAIKIVDELVLGGYIKDCLDTDDETEFEVQDIIQNVLIQFNPKFILQ